MGSSSINRAPAAAKATANVSTAQIFANAQTPTIACILPGQGGGVLEQKVFLVRASGYVTTAATLNVTATLYSGTSLTAGSNTVIAASTARAANSVSCPWWIEAELVFDSVSGKLQGCFHALVNNLYDAKAALSAVVTSVSGAANSAEPALNFVVAITFSVANAANVAGMGDFVLDA